MSEPQHYDVIIIGAGLTGVATAFYLAKAGASVLVLERQQINCGASGANAGSLHFQLEHRLIEHREQLAGELSFHAALASLAISDWRTLESELNTDIELEMTGGLMVAESEAQMEILAKKAELEQAQGLNVELLDQTALQSLAPYLSIQLTGALFCADEGHCNPRLLSHAFVRNAESLGARLCTQTEVQALVHKNAQWRIQTSSPTARKEWTAAAVVCAAGAWSANIARMANLHLPVFPVGLMLSVTEKVPPVIKHLVQHVGRKLSLKQVADGNILIGGGWSARLIQKHGQWDGQYKSVVDVKALQKNLLVASQVMPPLGNVHILRSWSGTTGITPDQLPIIGEFREAPRFYAAVGGSGFTYGPTYARLISELITSGSTGFPVDAYSPNRFSHINRFMGNA